MKKKKFLSILLIIGLGITSIIPFTLTHVSADIVKTPATSMYSTNTITQVTNGVGAIDASSDVAKFKGLKDFTFNTTFTLTSTSGVNSLFFLGDKDTSNNYIAVYISGDTLGVESRDTTGASQISDGTVKLTGMDLTKPHKLTFTMSGGHWVRFYVDGKLLKEIPVSIDFSQNLFDKANYLGFGNGKRADGMNSYPMSGTLENIELYNTALSEDDILSYQLGALRNTAYTYQNAYYPSASSTRISDDTNVSKIASLEHGSVSIRYHLQDENAGVMSLFSLSDKNTNNYIAFNIDPSQNIVSIDAPGITSLDGKQLALTDHQVSIKNLYWHTLSFTKEDSVINIYLDGTYIDQFKTGITKGFFNLLTNANSIGIGHITTLNGDLHPFVGAIDCVKVYPEILDETDILLQDAPTMWKPGTQIDMSNASKTTPYDLYYSGYQGSSSYRIPSLLTTRDGTTLAMADKRNTGSQDAGNIDSNVRRKEKGQSKFDEAKTILNLPENRNNPGSSAFTIDSSMVQDKDTGRIYAFMDMFPESSGLSDPSQLTNGTGYTNIDGTNYQVLYTKDKKEFGTIRKENGLGYVYDKKNQKTDYTVILDSVGDHHELGNLYKNGVYKGNIFLLKDSPDQGELHVLNTTYLWMLYSDDDGKNWSNPIDITGQVKQDWMVFLGTGPGTGIQLQNGNLVVPVYSTNKNIGGSQSSAVIISKDHGKTWELGESPQKNMGNDRATMNNSGQMFTESQAVQMNNGDVKLFMRNTYDNVLAGKVYMATSKDGGETWSKVEKTDVNDTYCQLSVLHYTKAGKEYIIMTNPDHSPRTQGMVHLGEVQADGSIAWNYNQILNKGKFQYSSLAIKSNDDKDPQFSLLYEDDSDGTFHLKYTEFDENFIKAPMEPEIMKPATLDNYKGEVTGNTIRATLAFDQPMMVAGKPELQLSLGGKTFNANYEKGSGTQNIVFTGVLPKDTTGIVQATGISLANGLLENIHNLSFTKLQVPLYDLTKITTGLSIHDYSSQQSDSTQEDVDGAAVNVIDNNPKTYWHSQWSDPNIALPQYVTVDLGQAKTIYKVGYLARQNNVSGRIHDYAIAVSNDGITYKVVQQGELLNTIKPQSIEFTPVQARYVRLIAKSAYQIGTGSCSMAEMSIYEYSNGVITQGDKTELTKLLDTVQTLPSTMYSKATWDALMESVKSAQTLLAESISSQNLLNLAYAQIEKEKDALIDITRAQDRLDELSKLKESDFTPTSWNAFIQTLITISPGKTRSIEDFNQAIQGIENKLGQAHSNKDVTDILMQVDTAFNALTKKANNQELASFVKQYQEEVLKEADYDTSSWNTFMKAMQNATALLKDANATQQQLDESRDMLIQARAGLKTSKAALQQLYNDYQLFVQKDYTDASWSTFAKALIEAKQTLDNADATPANVKKAISTLNSAAGTLKHNIDTSALQRLYGDSQQIDMSLYLNDSAKALQNALINATAIIKNPQSEQQVKDAQQAILTAYQNLQKKASQTDIKQLQSVLARLEKMDIQKLPISAQKQVQALITQIKQALAANEIGETNTTALLAKAKDINNLIKPNNKQDPSSASPTNKPAEKAVNTADTTHTTLAIFTLILSGGTLIIVNERRKHIQKSNNLKNK